MCPKGRACEVPPTTTCSWEKLGRRSSAFMSSSGRESCWREGGRDDERDGDGEREEAAGEGQKSVPWLRRMRGGESVAKLISGKGTTGSSGGATDVSA